MRRGVIGRLFLDLWTVFLAFAGAGAITHVFNDIFDATTAVWLPIYVSLLLFGLAVAVADIRERHRGKDPSEGPIRPPGSLPPVGGKSD
jgi:hypothetical protein